MYDNCRTRITKSKKTISMNINFQIYFCVTSICSSYITLIAITQYRFSDAAFLLPVTGVTEKNLHDIPKL
jgi:hypothetical protein